METFPTSEALTKAGKRKWDKFLHSHKLVRPQTYDKHIAVFEAADQWHASAAITATAVAYGIPLVTRKEDDSKHILGLDLRNPFTISP